MMASLGANLATWRAGHMATAGIWIRPFGNRLLRASTFPLFGIPRLAMPITQMAALDLSLPRRTEMPIHRHGSILLAWGMRLRVAPSMYVAVRRLEMALVLSKMMGTIVGSGWKCECRAFAICAGGENNRRECTAENPSMVSVRST